MKELKPVLGGTMENFWLALRVNDRAGREVAARISVPGTRVRMGGRLFYVKGCPPELTGDMSLYDVVTGCHCGTLAFVKAHFQDIDQRREGYGQVRNLPECQWNEKEERFELLREVS